MKILIIKPQIVTVEDTKRALRHFKRKFCEAEISLVANLFKKDYERLWGNKNIDEKIFFRPSEKELKGLELTKLFFNLQMRKFELAMVLWSKPLPHRYKKAKLMALLSGAKKVKLYSIKEEKDVCFLIDDFKRYLLKSPILFQSLFRVMLLKIRLLLQLFQIDIKDVVTGKLHSHRDVSLCFAQFSAFSNIAKYRKTHNRYLLRITNDTEDEQMTKAIIDIWSYENSSHLDGHYAQFGKNLSVKPKGSTEVEINFDWSNKASFMLQGRSLEVDEFWVNRLMTAKLYSVQSILYDNSGKEIDRLKIFQKLEI